MNIWIINLKPDDISLPEVKDYFFKHNIAGMGWRIDDESLKKEQYLAECSKYWEKGYRLACENYFRMAKGDLCLANNGVIYYIGMVADDKPFYAKVAEFEVADKTNYRFSWCRHVNWYPIGRQDETPAIIVAKQSARNQKTIDVRYEHTNTALYRYCRVVYNTVSGNQYFPNSPKISLTTENFAECLSDQDLEDLVGLFLQERHGYIFYPSSCKTATKDFEYIMLDKESRRLVYTQVKHNAPISIRHYIDEAKYGDCLIYLFSNCGYTELDCLMDSIYIIEKKDLFDYFVSNSQLFQKRLRFDHQIYSSF